MLFDGLRKKYNRSVLDLRQAMTTTVAVLMLSRLDDYICQMGDIHTAMQTVSRPCRIQSVNRTIKEVPASATLLKVTCFDRRILVHSKHIICVSRTLTLELLGE